MNKKANTLLFVLGATVVNVIVMVGVFIALLVPYVRFASPALPATVNQLSVFVLFLASIAITYFVYHRAVKYMASKIDMEHYFHPIFNRKKKR